MLLWGKNAFTEALKSGKSIEKVYLQYGKFFEPEFLRELQRKKIPFQWAKKSYLKKLSGTEKHQGIVFLLSPISYSDLSSLFKKAFLKRSFFVALDSITEPQNLGLIARTVESFGGVGLLLPKKGGAPVNEVALKASSGALFHLKVCKVDSLFKGLSSFKEAGGKVYSLETGGEDIRKVPLDLPCALVLGSEGKGIDEEILEISDRVLTIPTVGKTPSLNVSVSCAVGVWELFKRFW